MVSGGDDGGHHCCGHWVVVGIISGGLWDDLMRCLPAIALMVLALVNSDTGVELVL